MSDTPTPEPQPEPDATPAEGTPRTWQEERHETSYPADPAPESPPSP